MRLAFFAFLALTAGGIHAAKLQTGAISTVSSRTLEKLLNFLLTSSSSYPPTPFALPSIEFASLFLKAEITNLTCIQDPSSHPYIQASIEQEGKGNGTIALDVQDSSFQCNGDWSITRHHWPELEASGTVSISTTNLSLSTITLVAAKHDLHTRPEPKGLRLYLKVPDESPPVVSIQDLDLVFNSSSPHIPHWIAPLMSRIFKQILKENTESGIANSLKTYLEGDISNVLMNATSPQKICHHCSPPPPHHHHNDTGFEDNLGLDHHHDLYKWFRPSLTRVPEVRRFIRFITDSGEDEAAAAAVIDSNKNNDDDDDGFILFHARGDIARAKQPHAPIPFIFPPALDLFPKLEKTAEKFDVQVAFSNYSFASGMVSSFLDKNYEHYFPPHEMKGGSNTTHYWSLLIPGLEHQYPDGYVGLNVNVSCIPQVNLSRFPLPAREGKGGGGGKGEDDNTSIIDGDKSHYDDGRDEKKMMNMKMMKMKKKLKGMRGSMSVLTPYLIVWNIYDDGTGDNTTTTTACASTATSSNLLSTSSSSSHSPCPYRKEVAGVNAEFFLNTSVWVMPRKVQMNEDGDDGDGDDEEDQSTYPSSISKTSSLTSFVEKILALLRRSINSPTKDIFPVSAATPFDRNNAHYQQHSLMSITDQELQVMADHLVDAFVADFSFPTPLRPLFSLTLPTTFETNKKYKGPFVYGHIHDMSLKFSTAFSDVGDIETCYLDRCFEMMLKSLVEKLNKRFSTGCPLPSIRFPFGTSSVSGSSSSSSPLHSNKSLSSSSSSSSSSFLHFVGTRAFFQNDFFRMMTNISFSGKGDDGQEM